MSRLIVSVQPRWNGQADDTPPHPIQEQPAGPAAIEIRLCREPQGARDTPAVALVEIPKCDLVAMLRNGKPTPNIIKTVGELIRRDLDRHDQIKDSLQKIFRAEGHTPIHFILGAPEADDYPWEILYDKDELFVDARRWPIGRIKNSNNRHVDVNFRPPLRVLAVLAATGPADNNISAVREWRAIRQALESKGVDFHLRALVCEDELYEEISKIRSEKLTVDWIPDSENEILNRITEWQPRLVHFFCHGAGGTEPVLMVGTRGDREGKLVGNIKMTANKLADSDQQGSVWLITLNCCESASGTANFASALVVAGIPAAVGMRQKVGYMDAHVFAESLYAELGVLLGRIGTKKDPQTLEFAPAIAKARYRILEKVAQQQEQPPAAVASECMEWTFPVLYNRQDPIEVRNLSPAPAVERMSSFTELVVLEAELERRRQRGTPDDDRRMQQIIQRIADLQAVQDVLEYMPDRGSTPRSSLMKFF